MTDRGFSTDKTTPTLLRFLPWFFVADLGDGIIHWVQCVFVPFFFLLLSPSRTVPTNLWTTYLE